MGIDNKSIVANQIETVRTYFEPQLDGLGLSISDIEKQTLQELHNSLEIINDIARNPTSFGILKLKATAQASLIVSTTSESHFEAGILYPLLERKRLVNSRIQALEPSREQTRNLATNTIFGNPLNVVQYECDIFMIMPFSEDFQPIYDDHIKPIVESMGYKIKRGDDFFSKRSIMSDVWSAINNAKLVIAECTGRNPNVFYELGMAHALDKTGLMLSQNMSDIPFDIRHLRVIEYEYSPRGVKKLEKNILEAIKKLLS